MHEGGDAGHTFNGADFFRLSRPIHENGFPAGHEVGVETEHFAPQFLLETGHDRNDQNQHHDSQRDAENGDHGDQAEKGPLRPQIAQREEKAEGLGHGKVFGIFR